MFRLELFKDARIVFYYYCDIKFLRVSIGTYPLLSNPHQLERFVPPEPLRYVLLLSLNEFHVNSYVYTRAPKTCVDTCLFGGSVIVI